MKKKHYIEIELMGHKLKDPVPVYDGIPVDIDTAKKLNQNHIKFCKQILRILE